MSTLVESCLIFVETYYYCHHHIQTKGCLLHRIASVLWKKLEAVWVGRILIV